MDGDQDENLQLGADFLAERLDYEPGEELDEPEEISTVDKASPINQKDDLFQEFDSYDLDGEGKNDEDVNSRITNIEGDITGASVLKTEHQFTIDKTDISKEGSETVSGDDALSHLNVETTEDTATNVDSDTKNDVIESSEQIKSSKVEQGTKDLARHSAESICDEELEEGEVSDEDEEARKERLKPQPVCRFYSKGACTWGSSCRFIHPGVMDTGRYAPQQISTNFYNFIPDKRTGNYN